MDLNRRDFARSLGLGAAALALGSKAHIAFASTDDLSFVHPELRPAVKAMQGMNSRTLTAEFLMQARQGMAAFGKPARTDISVTERLIKGPRGAPDVTVYLINAKSQGARPAILHMHGGGYVLGSARSSIRDMQDIAEQLDCVTITVEYRLAPETRYDGSLEDNYSALLWLHDSAKQIGVDPDRIAIMGESAGAGHAALLALAARDRGKVPLCFQMLVYPMLDDRTGSTRPIAKNIGTIGWTAEANRFGWESFLGVKPGSRRVPAAGVPARRADLAGLPPAFIGVGGIDLFVDEDIEYAQRLIAAGVATELLVVPGAFHGFDIFAAQTGIAKRFTAAKMEALRQAFAS